MELVGGLMYAVQSLTLTIYILANLLEKQARTIMKHFEKYSTWK